MRRCSSRPPSDPARALASPWKNKVFSGGVVTCTIKSTSAVRRLQQMDFGARVLVATVLGSKERTTVLEAGCGRQLGSDLRL